MSNQELLAKSAKHKSLYKFFENNSFLCENNIQLKSNYSKGKESPWSQSFSGRCLKDIFSIDNPVFCTKFIEAISGDGQEANKITTLHSSSLASLLIFFSVSKKNPIYFPVDEQVVEFSNCRFEVKNEVCQGTNNFSNIDVVLYGDNTILYLESKFSEYLGTGSVEVKNVNYYNEMYGEEEKMNGKISRTLKDAGFTLRKKEDGKRYLELKDVKPFYNEGIKQMISHYLGLKTEITKNPKEYEKKRIILGEILFDFGKLVPIGNEKFIAYNNAYSQLRTGLNNCAKDDKLNICINQLVSYQEILRLKKNKDFLTNLPEKIKQFYRLDNL